MGTLFSKEAGIHEAIKSGDYTRVKYLIENYPVVVGERLPRFVGKTPLMEAACQGNYNIAELIIDKGETRVNVNEQYLGPEKTAYGSPKTALNFAIEGKFWEVVKLLILKGAQYHDVLEYAIRVNNWSLTNNLIKSKAALNKVISLEKINMAREAGYCELADLLLERNKEIEEGLVPQSFRENFTKLEERQKESEKENKKELEKLQQLIDEIKQYLVMDKNYIGSLDDYHRAVYLHLKWSLNSIYIAAFSCSNREGILISNKTGNLGKVGGMVKSAGSIAPSYIGTILEKLGDLLEDTDKANHGKMVKNFSELADSVSSMEMLIENIVKKTVRIIKDLDIKKIEKDMENFLDRFVETLSRISGVFAKYFGRPLTKSAKGAATDIVFSQVQSQIDQYIENEETASEATQLGKKHATVILALLTAKIYAWDDFAEYDSKQSNQAILIGFLGELVPKYQNDIESNQATKADTSTVAFAKITKYDNEILNNPELLQTTYKIGGIKLVNKLIDLGQDVEIGEQISQATKELGAEKVLKLFFGNEIKLSKTEVLQAQEQELIVNNRADQLLESIAKIEAIIGKEALAEITGWHNYLSTALSNNPLSSSATKVIQRIADIINDLEKYLDFGAIGESCNLDNHVEIILTQVENMFNFIESGITCVGSPQRYPDFDLPDDDYAGGSDGIYGSGNNYNNSGFGNQIIQPVILFAGQNATAYDS